MTEQMEIPGMIAHDPIQRVRKGVAGEVVFVERWQELMASMPPHWSPRDQEDEFAPPIELAHLAHILTDYRGRLGQREASVAASFICWLGCNMGRCLLDNAEKNREIHHSACVLVSWSLARQRHFGTSSGHTTAELILALPEDINPSGRMVSDPLLKTTELSVFDLEVIDQLCLWLGGEGHGFVIGCEQETRRRERFEADLQHNRNLAALKGERA